MLSDVIVPFVAITVEVKLKRPMVLHEKSLLNRKSCLMIGLKARYPVGLSPNALDRWSMHSVGSMK